MVRPTSGVPAGRARTLDRRCALGAGRIDRPGAQECEIPFFRDRVVADAPHQTRPADRPSWDLAVAGEEVRTSVPPRPAFSAYRLTVVGETLRGTRGTALRRVGPRAGRAVPLLTLEVAVLRHPRIVRRRRPPDRASGRKTEAGRTSMVMAPRCHGAQADAFVPPTSADRPATAAPMVRHLTVHDPGVISVYPASSAQAARRGRASERARRAHRQREAASRHAACSPSDSSHHTS